jgi:hypothetical protein
MQAKAMKALRSRTCRRSYSEDTLLERLAQHFKQMPLELGQLIKEQDTVVGPRHLARRGYLAAAAQAHIGNGLVGGATWAGSDDGGAPPGEPGDARDAGGVEGEGHRRQDGGSAVGQRRGEGPIPSGETRFHGSASGRLS